MRTSRTWARRILPALGVVALCAAALAARQHGGGAATPAPPGPTAGGVPAPLAWAYGVPAGAGTPASAPAPAAAGAAGCAPPQDAAAGNTPQRDIVQSGAPQHVPSSSASFTLAQIGDCFAVADWFPGDHPAMPDIVAHGHRPEVEACAYCHYPTGKGRPENAALAGLPIPYFAKEMSDFKSGARASVDPSPDMLAMISFAKSMSDAEVQAAAEYFGSLQWSAPGNPAAAPWIKVVESATAPKTREQDGELVVAEGGATEPLAHRIVEVPADAREALLRDSRSGYIAYVPVGSIARGKDLVENGGSGRTLACDNCHGRGLTGLGVTAAIAGRSPSYTARQLYDIQQGVRKGTWVAPMTDVTAKLTPDDIVAISAYLATLTP